MAKVTHLHPINRFDPATAFQMKGASSQVTLTFALLETVRLVLEEGQDTEDEEKHAPLSPDHNTSSGHTSDSYLPRNRRPAPTKLSGILGGPCAHCGATESPQWRRPLTKKVVLCNACGIYYSRHHSLPKRKKMSPTKHSAFDAKEEDSGAEQDLGLEPPVAKKAPVCTAPEKVQRSPSANPALVPLPTGSTSSVDCLQLDPPQPAAPLGVCTPTNSVGMPPEASRASPVLCSGRSLANKRRADTLEPAPSANQSLAKRPVKRAAAKASARVSPPDAALKGDSSGASDADVSRRPVITTAITSVLTPVKSAANDKSYLPLPMDMPFHQVHSAPHPIVVGGRSAPSSALSEQSADSDIAMFLIPTSTCRGPRQSISSKTANLWP